MRDMYLYIYFYIRLYISILFIAIRMRVIPIYEYRIIYNLYIHIKPKNDIGVMSHDVVHCCDSNVGCYFHIGSHCRNTTNYNFYYYHHIYSLLSIDSHFADKIFLLIYTAFSWIRFGKKYFLCFYFAACNRNSSIMPASLTLKTNISIQYNKK